MCTHFWYKDSKSSLWLIVHGYHPIGQSVSLFCTDFTSLEECSTLTYWHTQYVHTSIHALFFLNACLLMRRHQYFWIPHSLNFLWNLNNCLFFCSCRYISLCLVCTHLLIHFLVHFDILLPTPTSLHHVFFSLFQRTLSCWSTQNINGTFVRWVMSHSCDFYCLYSTYCSHTTIYVRLYPLLFRLTTISLLKNLEHFL